MTAFEISNAIVDSFQDARDVINFLRADIDAQAWGNANEVAVSDLEFNEAISRIRDGYKEKAVLVLEKNFRYEDEQRLAEELSDESVIVRNMTLEEACVLADTNIDQAREEFNENGTLF